MSAEDTRPEAPAREQVREVVSAVNNEAWWSPGTPASGDVRAVPAPLVMPQDEFEAVKRSARILANIVARNLQAMEAARIEMRQNGPHAGMQWILNSIPDVWDDEETEWDGKESAQAWFDRTEAFYRDAEAAAPAVSPPPVAAALSGAQRDRYRELTTDWEKAVTAVKAALGYASQPHVAPAEIRDAAWDGLAMLEGSEEEQASG